MFDTRRALLPLIINFFDRSSMTSLSKSSLCLGVDVTNVTMGVGVQLSYLEIGKEGFLEERKKG